MTDEELEAMRQRADAATPGPWFVRHLDDDYAASLVAIAITPDTGKGERWSDFDHGEIVAATLIQNPARYVDAGDGLWDENAAFIASARTDLPRLIDEINELRARLAESTDD